MQILPNRYPHIGVRVRIQTPYSGACPVSGEPHAGSWIAVEYEPAALLLDFRAVALHLPTYATEATDVEAVVQMLARDASAALGVPVNVEAHYILQDGIELRCNSFIAPDEISGFQTSR